MTIHSEETARGGSTYTLGHSDAEIQRLLLQGRIYNQYTANALRMAGLRPGMRVLDVGCGPDDVSIAASRLVGPTGTVVGVDASADVIELARTRGAELGACDMQFEQAAVEEVSLDETVDAVIGRAILVHLPEPEAILRHLCGQIRPGGIIAFGETDITLAGTVPATPLWHAVQSAICDTFLGMGLDPAFGRCLHALFRRAGLQSPQLTLSRPMVGADETDLLALMTDAWRSVYPMAQQLGTVTDETADTDTLQARLQKELANKDAIVMMPPLITAWTRL